MQGMLGNAWQRILDMKRRKEVGNWCDHNAHNAVSSTWDIGMVMNAPNLVDMPCDVPSPAPMLWQNDNVTRSEMVGRAVQVSQYACAIKYDEEFSGWAELRRWPPSFSAGPGPDGSSTPDFVDFGERSSEILRHTNVRVRTWSVLACRVKSKTAAHAKRSN